MLGYGLVFGTILLSCMLFKTCSIDTHPRNNRRTARDQEIMEMNRPDIRSPMMNQNISKHEINEEIAYHEDQIRKLKHLER